MSVLTINRNVKAYTLIEVLIVMFIFSIVSMLILLTFSQVSKNKIILQNNGERLQELQAAIALIVFDLSQVVAKTEPDSSARLQGTFYSRNNDLHFYKLGNINPQYQNHFSSLEKIRYFLKDKQLIRESYLAEEGKVFTQIILNKVTSLEWHFIVNKANSYDLWPPVEELKFKIPVGVRIVVNTEDYGMLEKIIELPGKSYEIRLNEA